VEIVPEDYTSQRCSICGVKHKKGRVYRGLYMQEDWEEDQCRYKRCAEHSKKAGTQDKDS
jgi:transposase